MAWINEGLVIPDGERLKSILSRPDRLSGIVTLVEEIVEEKVTTNLPINDVKLKLQDLFLGLSYYMFVQNHFLLSYFT